MDCMQGPQWGREAERKWGYVTTLEKFWINPLDINQGY